MISFISIRMTDYPGIHLELSRVSDGNLSRGLSALGSIAFDLLDDIHTIDDLAKNDVLSVQPLGLGGGQEELGAVGVSSSVGHRQHSRSRVLQLEVFVSKLLSVDGLASSAVVVGEVASLAHEVGDDTVESASLVTESLFAGAKGPEVLSSLGDDVITELHGDASKRRVAGGDVEEDFDGHFFGVSGVEATLILEN